MRRCWAAFAVSCAVLVLWTATLGAAAQAAGSSRVRIAPPREPGTQLVVHVRVENEGSGRPVPGARLFVYQTDDAGYYDRGEGGRERGPRNSRLHGTAYADSAGSIVFDTIVPGSYPGSGIFRHIHYRLNAAGYIPEEKEIILDEAPRPSQEQKRWAERNGDIVTRRVKGPNGTSEIRVTLRIQPAR